ncbi:MAG TPA: hypothetical protein VKP61_11050 [Candidatus Acidoferrum sp.]|nr:hypothetical protein [Candidatus Acidoferrum sp.]
MAEELQKQGKACVNYATVFHRPVQGTSANFAPEGVIANVNL